MSVNQASLSEDPGAATDIFDEDGVAARYGIPPATVRAWRRARKGPQYFHAGRYVRYRMSDLLAWEEQEVQKRALRLAR